MTPLFGYDRRKRFDEALAGGVAGDKRDTTGGGLLFTPGVIGEDGFEGDRREIDPSGVGRQM
jgi:hypothetical protein